MSASAAARHAHELFNGRRFTRAFDLWQLYVESFHCVVASEERSISTSWSFRARPVPAPATPSEAPWDRPYLTVADERDIYHCFRLLLGRSPNREEWRGHAMREGEDLASVVASYLNSLEFARRGLLNPAALADVVLTSSDAFSIHTAKDDLAVGKYVRELNYESDVTALFRHVLRPGMGVLDIGANIGWFSMLSASIVGASGHVVAVEPNPRNARLLEASRRENGFDHVQVLQMAAGHETGLLVLNTSHSNGTTSGLPDGIGRLLDAETVPCVRLDALLPRERRIDLIKVDVEGAEYNALLGCTETIARWHPVIVSEFSPDMMVGISGITGPEYLAWLGGLGYAIAVIEPDGTTTGAGGDVELVMRHYFERGSDHIDIVATPTGAGG